MVAEEVEDEILALASIYEELFCRFEDNKIRAIIVSEDEDCKERLYIEALLPDDYPENATPSFSLDNLNNAHVSCELKQDILDGLAEQVIASCVTSSSCAGVPQQNVLNAVYIGWQASAQLGACSLYSVIEWAREQLPAWYQRVAAAAQPDDHAQNEGQPMHQQGGNPGQVLLLKRLTYATKR